MDFVNRVRCSNQWIKYVEIFSSFIKRISSWMLYVNTVKSMFVVIDIAIIFDIIHFDLSIPISHATETLSAWQTHLLEMKWWAWKIDWNSFTIENKTLCQSYCHWNRLEFLGILLLMFGLCINVCVCVPCAMYHMHSIQ